MLIILPKFSIKPTMSDNQINKFKKESKVEINKQSKDKKFKNITKKWLIESHRLKYTYHFNWFGIPIIQYPSDIIGVQEIIYQTKPDLIIEAGIAHGGSIIFHATILEMLSQIDKKERKVVGIDIDIRKHNLRRIKNHHLNKNLILIEGSSLDEKVKKKIHKIVKNKKKIMVILDSNHSSKHVYEELSFYTQFVSKNSYCIVFDTIVENLPEKLVRDKPWGKGDNPLTAVKLFLDKNNNFKIDKEIDKKLMISSAENGFLKKIR